MNVTTLIEIEITKPLLLTNTSTGEQRIRLTLEEARELHAELSKLFPPKLIQGPNHPLQQPYAPGQVPGIWAPNPYLSGPTVKYETRDPMTHERIDAASVTPLDVRGVSTNNGFDM